MLDNTYFLAIAATACWAINNLIDKILLHKLIGDKRIPALLSFTCLSSLISVILGFTLSQDSLWLSFGNTSLLVASGCFQVVWMFLYLHALSREDVSVVMALMLAAPLFLAISGFGASTSDIIVCATILFGVFLLLSSNKRMSFQGPLILLALGAAAAVATANTLFKLGVPDETRYWAGVFWQSLGTTLLGVVMVTGMSEVRDELRSIFSDNNRSVAATLITNEGLLLSGNLLFNASLAGGHLLLVQTLDSLQSVFVFVFSAVLAAFHPTLIGENIGESAILKKTLGITIACLGTAYIIFTQH